MDASDQLMKEIAVICNEELDIRQNGLHYCLWYSLMSDDKKFKRSTFEINKPILAEQLE